MNFTELLVTGFDGDTTIFAASLMPNVAANIVARTDSDGEVAVEVDAERATLAFSSIHRLMEDLTSHPSEHDPEGAPTLLS